MQMQIIIEKFLRSEKSHQYKLSAFERIIMIMLASYMGNKNNCWPSYKSLEIDCGISKRTLIRNIKKLEQKEIIQVTRQQEQNNIYQFYPQVVSNRHYPSDQWTPGSVYLAPEVVSIRHPNNINNNYKNNHFLQPKEWKGLSPSASKVSNILEYYLSKEDK